MPLKILLRFCPDGDAGTHGRVGPNADRSSAGSSPADWLPRSCSAWSERFGPATGEAPQSINKSLGLLTIVACLTILYALIFRLSKNILFQARFQLAVDVLLVTWLVWNSNVIQSPYIALYILIIAISSLFLGPREAVSDVCRLCGRVHGLRAPDHRCRRTKRSDETRRRLAVADDSMGRTV